MEQNKTCALSDIINSCDSLIFDESILRDVSQIFLPFLPKESGEKAGQKTPDANAMAKAGVISEACAVYDFASEVISSKKSLAHEGVYEVLKTKVSTGVAPLSIAYFFGDSFSDVCSAHSNLVKSIEDKKKPVLCTQAKSLSGQIISVLKDIERNFDIFEKQGSAESIFENMSYAAMFALLFPAKNHVLLVQNENYAKIFDAFFGLAYSEQITTSKKLEDNHVAKNWGFPKLQIVSYAPISQNSQCAQYGLQFEVLRDTQETQKSVALPACWDKLTAKQKDIGIREFKHGLGKIHVLRTVIESLDSILLNGNETANKDIAKQILEVSAPNRQNRNYVGKDGKVLPCIGVMPSKKPIKQIKPTKSIRSIRSIRSINQANCANALTNSEGDYEMVKLLDEQKLKIMYETMRMPGSELKIAFESGEFETKIKGYVAILDLAQKVGAKSVVSEITSDLELIRRYIDFVYSDSFAVLVCEKEKLLGEKESIDKRICEINKQVEGGKKNDKYLLLLDALAPSAPKLCETEISPLPAHIGDVKGVKDVEDVKDGVDGKAANSLDAKTNSLYMSTYELGSVEGAKKAATIRLCLRQLSKEGKVSSRLRQDDKNYTVGRHHFEYELNESVVKVAFKDENVGLEFLAKALSGENVLPKSEKKDFKELLEGVSKNQYFSAEELSKYDGVQKLHSLKDKLRDVVREGKIKIDTTLSDSRKGPTKYLLNFDVLKGLVCGEDAKQMIVSYAAGKA